MQLLQYEDSLRAFFFTEVLKLLMINAVDDHLLQNSAHHFLLCHHTMACMSFEYALKLVAGTRSCTWQYLESVK